jgi:hypothetical protein
MPPCFKIEAQPTTSKINDRATKYFAFPIQSTLTPLNNSIPIPIHLCLTPDHPGKFPPAGIANLVMALLA